MAEGTMDRHEPVGHPPAIWASLARIFQVALDPKKLLLAAAGIFVMGIGWWVLSAIAYGSWTRPAIDQLPYNRLENYSGATPEEQKARRDAEYQRDFDAWKLLHKAAGTGYDPDAGVGGKFRTLPWREDRGPNPYLLVTGQSQREWSWLDEVKVLLEPLIKFLTPVIYLFNSHATPGIRIYLLAIIAWTLLTWAFIGGMITRLAAVELAGKDPLTLREAFRFVVSRYLTYVSAPLAPLIVVAILVLLQILFGFFHLIPLFGDVVMDGLLFPLLILAGIAQTLLLVGLIGYPLMFPTVSAEGNDTLDAVSRTYSYVYQSLWNYFGYGIVAMLYGVVLVFLVGFLGSLMVYLSKWGLSQTPGTDYFKRQPDYLFIYAPTSYEWRTLLLQGSPAVEPDGRIVYEPTVPVVPTPADANAPKTQPSRYYAFLDGQSAFGEFHSWNYIAAFMVGVWLTILFFAILGFSYSYFWVASTQIYLLMRRKVDDTDLDEVYLEDETAEEPFSPPPPSTPPNPSLTMVEAPTLRTPSPSTPLVERPATLPEPAPTTPAAESTTLAPPEKTETDGGSAPNGPPA